MHKTFKTAFTLAEVLLTITIIGVIAALTIPSLLAKVNNSQYPAQLKEVYSTLQQSFSLLKAENGNTIVPLFANAGTDKGVAAMDAFLSKMLVTKSCEGATGCLYSTPLYYLNGGTQSSNVESYESGQGSAILSNGTMISLFVISPPCNTTEGTDPNITGNVCGELDVDLNGAKGPNIEGIDFFKFWLSKEGIFPYGSMGDTYPCGTGTSGVGCAAKVLQEGAINYNASPHS